MMNNNSNGNNTHKRLFIIVAVIVALCIGLVSGIQIGKASAFTDNTFWSGTAKGIIVEEGTVVAQVPDEMLFVTPYSIGQDYYPSGQEFDLEELQVRGTTYLTLYVRNSTKKITNVYPVVTQTSNLEITTPLSNSFIYPGGWAQFVFVIKALEVGKYSINIGFKGDEKK